MLEHFEEDPLTTEKIKEAATNFRPAIMKDCIILEPPVTLIRKSDGKLRRADIIDERRGSVHLIGTSENIWFKASYFKLLEEKTS